jgi:hypothetical protein
MKVLVYSAQILVVLLTVPHLAFAYIDPGTGATFVGSLGPILVGIVGGAFALFLKFFWHPIRRIFVKEQSSDSTEESSD